MTAAGVEAAHAGQQLAPEDTIAWDEIDARACRQAPDAGFARLFPHRNRSR